MSFLESMICSKFDGNCKSASTLVDGYPTRTIVSKETDQVTTLKTHRVLLRWIYPYVQITFFVREKEKSVGTKLFHDRERLSGGDHHHRISNFQQPLFNLRNDSCMTIF